MGYKYSLSTHSPHGLLGRVQGSLKPSRILPSEPSWEVGKTELDKLTEDQRAAVCLVLNNMVEVKNCATAQEVAAVEPLRVILAGSAGTSKTRVIRVIYSFAWAMLGPGGMRNVAPSGTAAFLMNGSTIHSLFPVPMGPAQFSHLAPPKSE